ncbi:MAG: BatD family protein [SAR202 cluster bacterium]|jgi:hypothetical protein|nr:BatD family protein [SAR202 cluster bacterium]MDP6512566.1 BatD family protein [SAR202 cluster bacterium]MDP6714453.1 BatD family protein [SAR202 cluster bacterium]
MLKGTIKKTALAAILILALAINVGVSHAQSMPVTARVDRATISTDEILTLTVTIIGETNVPLPVLPDLEGAQIVGRSTRSQITITNGKASAEFNFDFRLQPLREGPLKIEPVSVTINGVEYRTDPIVVTVVQGTGQAGGASAPQAPSATSLVGQDYFLQAEVDNDTPYLGEQITYTASFFDARSFGGRQRYRPPGFTGFWNSQEGERRTYNTLTAGRRYSVTETTSILFPTVAGDVEIGPAVMEIPSGFFGGSRNPHASQPVPVTVKPLPSGAPPAFTGAVGSYQISASVDTTDISSTEPVTLTINLTGRGNLEALPEPAWPDMPGWRIFDNQTNTDTFNVGGALGGSRTYQRVLIPETTGFLNVPAVEYAYFDLTEERYLTIATQPIAVTVSLDTTAAAIDFPNALSALAIDQAGSDIRHIKPSPSSLAFKSEPLTSRRLYWVLWALPAVLLIASIGWRFRERLGPVRGEVDQAVIARETALTTLHNAQQSGSNPFAASEETLVGYLSTRLDRPVSGLTHQEISSLLVQANISANLAQEIEILLDLNQDGQYGPAQLGDSVEPVLDQTERLIDELEWEFEQ